MTDKADNIDMAELRENLLRLTNLVTDPQPGLMTWEMFFYDTGAKISANFIDADLLLSVEELLKEFEPLMMPGCNVQLQEIRIRARAAIAKAKGSGNGRTA